MRWLEPDRLAAGGAGLVVYLGNVRRGEYESVRSRGLAVGLLADVTSNGRMAPASELDVVIPWDGRDVDAAVSMIVELSASVPLAGVLNLREIYVEAYSRLGAALGFGALCPGLVDAVRSKPTMRATFVERIGCQATTAFAEATDDAAIRAFAARVGYPVVLKPSALYGSLFVTRIDREAEIVPTLARVSAAFRRYADGTAVPIRRRGLQVEKFLKGSNHSVDCLVDRHGQVFTTPVVDVVTGQELGWPDFHHFARFAPSRTDEDSQRRMTATAVAAIHALGLRSTVAHVEFILSDGQPHLLEIGARPGGHRCRILSEAHGIDLISAYLAMIRGLPVQVAERWRRPFAIVTPFPPRRGAFSGLRAENRVTGLASYRWHEVSLEPGSPVGTVHDGQSSFVNIELRSDDMVDLEADVEAISRMTDLVVTRDTARAGRPRRRKPSRVS